MDCRDFKVLFVAFCCLICFLDCLNSKELTYRHYSFRKKQRHAKKYPSWEKDCQNNKCHGLAGLELTKCTRQCLSQSCYNELYAWDELEEGEIDVRLTSFKGCVIKEMQEQESRNRGL